MNNADNLLPFRTLLIVDDDPDILRGLVGCITQLGYRTLAANDAYEALSILETEHPHAILCDIMMPKMNGIQFLSHLRSLGKNIPFVFLTGATQSQYILEAMRLGALDFLQKPFEPTDLGALVERVLEIGIKQDRIEETLLRIKSLHPDITEGIDKVLQETRAIGQLSAFNSSRRTKGVASK